MARPITQVHFREVLKGIVPYEIVLASRLLRTRDGKSVLNFLLRTDLNYEMRTRIGLLSGIYDVSRHVPCAHGESEILQFAVAILLTPASVPGVFVEAGCFKGGSTAKFSLFTRIAGRQLVVFDSFRGIPENTEVHGRNLHGDNVAFIKGDYSGSMEEVKENVRRYGDLSVCRFVEGYFEESMPGFREPVAGAYLDVDLASSTRTCLKYLWPLLSGGGKIYSQDGHLPLVLQVFADRQFWESEIGSAPPDRVFGAGREKVVWIQKPFPLPA
jgi:O-methyltransferase